MQTMQSILDDMAGDLRVSVAEIGPAPVTAWQHAELAERAVNDLKHFGEHAGIALRRIVEQYDQHIGAFDQRELRSIEAMLTDAITDAVIGSTRERQSDFVDQATEQDAKRPDPDAVRDFRLGREAA